MKIISIKELEIPEIKVIRFSRFTDDRGYFSEQFRKSDLIKDSGITSLENIEFVQANQSYSKPGVVRGLHFQWNPYMGKLVRTIAGRMVDLILDIRKESPTHGKLIAYEMPSSPNQDYDEWIWIPPGFAHGNYFTEPTTIEYFCSGEYSPGCEAGISPLAEDIDWSLCDGKLKKELQNLISSPNLIISDKDKNALSLGEWERKEESNNFLYETLKDPANNNFSGQGILVTGGSGLLGTSLKNLMPDALFPTRDEFDITDIKTMEKYFKRLEESKIKITTIMHGAAFTSPPIVEKDPSKGIDANIIGTSNVVNLCLGKGIKLVYISTDYLFKGNKGNYSEYDEMYPVNKYAWSKMGGESAVMMYDNSLIIRTSFGEQEFPYEKAFSDQYTSREGVEIISKKIKQVLSRNIIGILHLGGKRKTVLEYAKELNPEKEIGSLSRDDVGFPVPKDTSLNCEKQERLGIE
jgi:dTDP-4-dehydrorhamnose 3,5-epimerase